MEFLEHLRSIYKVSDKGIFLSDSHGYWSNLSKDENRLLIEELLTNPAREALVKHQPLLEEVVYSPRRQAGLELLMLSGQETCVDYGCMWGALTVPLAKRTQFVLGVDQTMDSLVFAKARTREEHVDNVEFLCADLRVMLPFEVKVDVAVVNGVLEWIPEEGSIDLRKYYGKFTKKKYTENPFDLQRQFLEKVNGSLKKGGKIYLAIENRYDFKMFFGVKDPHSNLLFTSFLPRQVASLISSVKLGRPYVNWLYSFNAIRSLLIDSGFSSVELYMCFPDYRFPDSITPYESPLNDYRLTISSRNANGKRKLKRLAGRSLEYLVFKILKAKYFSPSIIAIGHK